MSSKFESEEVSVRPLFSWTEELRRISTAVDQKTKRSTENRKHLFYFLHWQAKNRQVEITLHQGHEAENAELCREVHAIKRRAVFMTDEDTDILKLLNEEAGESVSFYRLTPETGAHLLEKMAQTERLYFAEDSAPLMIGEARTATLNWQCVDNAPQRPYLDIDPAITYFLPFQSAWYIDLDLGLVGPLALQGDAGLVASLFDQSLLQDAGNEEGLPYASYLPTANDEKELRQIETAAIPVLRFLTLQVYGSNNWRHYQENQARDFFDIVQPVFRYGNIEITPESAQELIILPDGEIVRPPTLTPREKHLIAQLAQTGLETVPPEVLHGYGRLPANAYGLSQDSDWEDFMEEEIPRLQHAGWEIEFDADFRHYALKVDSWEAQLAPSGNGWFDLDMGIIIEGKRQPLAPLLSQLFKTDSRWLTASELHQIADNEKIQLKSAQGQRLSIEAGRLKPLAITLIDLFDGYSGGATLRLSRFDAPRLIELNNTARWQFRGQRDIMDMADRLVRAQEIKEVSPPLGLTTELRHYQLEGLAWLQFLREQNLSGILADDMGLGKTVQALAHILAEKEAGRLDLPVLIVIPTSLVFNWENEAARFTPSLRLLCLHGTERKQRFSEIKDHDVIITTYALLWRDADELNAFQYHLLILDEAQMVKNVSSTAATVIRKIEARHRLCLTGTPLENHLGELWSQFDFLLPGFLGTRKAFTKYWRTPIEKQQDASRHTLLSQRIRPFILRRKKEEVVKELPPKTVIVRKVELAEGQRDLYETIRAAMDALVRKEVNDHGFNRSQIVILDAMLKLRQICCDPRLLRSLSAQRTKERAKLDLLIEMLTEQLEGGRRILIFSQFTRMLALIEAELQRHGMRYVILTGQTTDRQSPVQRFQAGEVPIFLISLKAGGVGLNLTAADTVIHYDPWWNPAVEEQATDRAHRIGQDKPVFVYKLIVAGSIEEKILELQHEKAKLAEGILSTDGTGMPKFTEESLAMLFAPLPP